MARESTSIRGRVAKLKVVREEKPEEKEWKSLGMKASLSSLQAFHDPSECRRGSDTPREWNSTFFFQAST